MPQIAVLGLDEFNAAKLRATTHARDYTFEPLLDHDEVRGLAEFRFDELLAEARARLAANPVAPSGLCSFWDFPVNEMVAVLTSELGLPGPSLEGIVRVQNKFLSRLIQAQVVPEVVPAFCIVDPFNPHAARDITLEYPFWLKPVRSFRSHLAFRVRDRRELDAALEQIRDGIARLAEPYDEVLKRVVIPDEFADVDGWHCIAEAAVSGWQCTVEGFVYDGACTVYGIVDSVRHNNRSTFRRYEYPSRLPGSVQRRMTEITEKAIYALDLDNSPFNVEYFWDRRADRLWLIEVNVRQSQSHADLFEKVDGVPNHQVMVDLALARRPIMPRRQGRFDVAAKWFVRAWHDGVVTRVPSAEELDLLSREFPGTAIILVVDVGDRLSRLPDQDSYSYELAVIYSAAGSHSELMTQHAELTSRLRFEVA